MSSGYEQIYESLIPKLCECELLKVAERLGLSPRQDATLGIVFGSIPNKKVILLE